MLRYECMLIIPVLNTGPSKNKRGNCQKQEHE